MVASKQQFITQVLAMALLPQSSQSSASSTPAPALGSGAGASASAGHAARRIALLYRRNVELDEQLVRILEPELQQRGYRVFIDRHMTMGMDWAHEIERQIRQADAVMPLISADSARSEMLGFEIENAHEASQEQQGLPQILPIRVGYTGPLPEPMSGIVGPIQYFLWESPADSEGLLTELDYALRHLPAPNPAARKLPSKGTRLTTKPKPVIARETPAAARMFAHPLPLETVGGAVPLNSDFYVKRPTDAEFHSALERLDSIVLIKGARQMGKTSLLARGLAAARDAGANTAFTDLQKLNASNLETVDHLYLSLAESLADQLDLSVTPSDVWDQKRGPNVNFDRFLRREVLAKLKGPLVWGLDEVDRLFVCPFGSEAFGLFRSWHNERALDPTGPWSKLTLAIAYASEAHLFITDLNQSPFNVGTRLTLEDLAPLQVADLNRRHKSPLQDPDELNRFTHLVGGHPYLVRRGLYEIATQELSIGTFEMEASRDEGLYGDHLRRILVLLARDPALRAVMRGVLHGQPCPTPESFYRLRSGGVVSGSSPTDVRPRCRLYAMYLKRHLD